MKNVLRRSAAAMMIAMLVSLAAFLDAGKASAQACAVTNVTNLTSCTVNLCLYDMFFTVNCYVIPPGGPTGIVLGGFVPIGVQSVALNFHPFIPPPTPGCTKCIGLPKVGGGVCCAIVCYDSATCRIRISQCATPCAP